MTNPLHDSHTIPAADTPRPSPKELLDAAEALTRQAKSCPSCPHCGEIFHVEPAKTHDLSISRVGGGHLNPNVIITVSDGPDERDVYLPAGVARDLGRVLAPLTPAQRQLLVDDLTGGAS